MCVLPIGHKPNRWVLVLRIMIIDNSSDNNNHNHNDNVSANNNDNRNIDNNANKSTSFRGPIHAHRTSSMERRQTLQNGYVWIEWREQQQ